MNIRFSAGDMSWIISEHLLRHPHSSEVTMAMGNGNGDGKKIRVCKDGVWGNGHLAAKTWWDAGERE